MIMEGVDEDMEADVITQHDDGWEVTSSWRIKMDLILNKYQIKSLLLFKKLLFL